MLRSLAGLELLRTYRAHIYRGLWEDAAAEVGADVMDGGSGVLEVSLGGRSTLVQQEVVSLDDAAAIEVSFDKPLVHRMLAARGLPVPTHVELGRTGTAGLPALGPCPWVVKPADAGVGAGVTCGVRTPAQLRRARLVARRFSERVLVELEVPGESFRILVLDGEVIGAVRREAPRVTGDGRSTIAQLVATENDRRLAARGQAGLWLLRIDHEMLFTLRAAGLGPRSVLPAGTTIAVKTATNQNAAHENHTVHELHPDVRAAVVASAKAVGLRLAGVDLIARSVTEPLATTGGVVLEVNALPGLHHHALVSDENSATRVAVPILRKLLECP